MMTYLEIWCIVFEEIVVRDLVVERRERGVWIGRDDDDDDAVP